MNEEVCKKCGEKFGKCAHCKKEQMFYIINQGIATEEPTSWHGIYPFDLNHRIDEKGTGDMHGYYPNRMSLL